MSDASQRRPIRDFLFSFSVPCRPPPACEGLHPNPPHPNPPKPNNQQVMRYPQYADLWQNVLVLFAMFVGCMFLAYLALKRSTPL